MTKVDAEQNVALAAKSCVQLAAVTAQLSGERTKRAAASVAAPKEAAQARRGSVSLG